MPLWLEEYGARGVRIIKEYLNWIGEWRKVLTCPQLCIKSCDPNLIRENHLFARLQSGSDESHQL